MIKVPDQGWLCEAGGNIPDIAEVTEKVSAADDWDGIDIPLAITTVMVSVTSITGDTNCCV